MLALFFSELTGLSKLAEFTIVPFDTAVDEDKVWVWKKGKKQTWNVLCGGTDFNAPTDYVNKRGDFDGLIILTDLEAPKPKALSANECGLQSHSMLRIPTTTNEMCHCYGAIIGYKPL